MDVCGEMRWTDCYCHPHRVRGWCTVLLGRPQSVILSKHVSFCSVEYVGDMLLHYYSQEVHKRFQEQRFTHLDVYKAFGKWYKKFD